MEPRQPPVAWEPPASRSITAWLPRLGESAILSRVAERAGADERPSFERARRRHCSGGAGGVLRPFPARADDAGLRYPARIRPGWRRRRGRRAHDRGAAAFLRPELQALE